MLFVFVDVVLFQTGIDKSGVMVNELKPTFSRPFFFKTRLILTVLTLRCLCMHFFNVRWRREEERLRVCVRKRVRDRENYVMQIKLCIFVMFHV